jgi:phage shock protein PspC (stress-responsive transcriptional regulator)
MNGRLYRSRTDSIVGGVCGGLARYFGIDSVLVRLLFILLLWSGMSVLAYIVLWIIMPLEPQAEAALTTRPEAFRPTPAASGQTGILFGGFLLMVGLVALFQNFFGWITWLNFATLWPLLLIALGVAVIWRRGGGGWQAR